MKPKVCYISNFYLGERRVEVQAQPALYIDHVTCVNIDEGYSKTNK